ncbi:VOC family protein [Chitinophaga sp. MM2321]|uniref:VOC family protein n=1 Tax=Chitinophaga sp. MM2321 TaxID=3137178 RepID=UPI0032D56BE4
MQTPDQRLSFLTLGVRNLQQMKTFYVEKFGWTPLKEEEAIVFFKLNGFILGLFSSVELAKDAGVKHEEHSYKGFTLAYNLRSEKEVDDLFAAFKANGVKIVKPAEKVFWGGYTGYIADVEDNLWEIAYNPFLEMDAAGNVITHK